MVDRTRVLRIAASIPGSIVYDHFAQLRPPGHSDSFWLYPIKNILLQNGYICHEARKRDEWGKCGYSGLKTHFHRGK